eukprot:TRINITY_DN3083_c0_g1_i1.p2 TRINITY_DN3083_c0_g1~~TRINITY_DN3083_c0_g1_i1.p2  ORF type:complete len:235 (+),score=25.16 TRINITY_DN3083_c0_g1_i1:104-808(+)
MSAAPLNSPSVTQFCKQSLDPVAMSVLIQKNKGVGLSDPALEDNLRKGDYKKVLEAVWSERDRSRRLEWLQSKFAELHVVLMFELAIALFAMTPTAQVLFLTSIPLFRAAAFRALQDAACSPEAVNDNIDVQLYFTYQQRITALKAKHQLDTSETFSHYEQQKDLAGIAKMMEVIQLSLTIDLPSPDWVSGHNSSMHPPSQYKQRRDEYAQQTLKCLVIQLNGERDPATGVFAL